MKIYLSLIDPNTNREIKDCVLNCIYIEAQKRVDKMNKRLSVSQKNRGLYWKITQIYN
jgi:hypothetical protein